METIEYKTVVNCSKFLETALDSDRDVVYFLNCEGFITQDVCDEVLKPSMWTGAQKAGLLVTGIRNKVSLSPQHYSKFVDYLRGDRSKYGGIVDLLDREYQKQKQTKHADPPGVPVTVSLPFSRYGQYLRYYYKNSSIVPDDKLSIAPCSEFINLALIVKTGDSMQHEINDFYRQDTNAISIDEIPALKSPLEMDSIITPDTQAVLVEGAPGVGKSTLCWELCRQWDNLKSLQSFKLVLLLKLRERRVQTATTLNEVFYHRNLRLCQSVVDEVFDCEGEGVLLIFDGFDELPASVVRDSSCLIMELIRGICLPGATRLVSSRPSAPERRKCLPPHCTCVEVLGFTDECKLKFAEKAFESDPDTAIQFKNFIHTNPVISSLTYIPVNCAILAQIFKDIRGNKKQVPKTMTQLYCLLTLVLIRRHMIATGDWNEQSPLPDRLEDLPENAFACLVQVSEVACYGLLEPDIQLVFYESDIGDGFQTLGLLAEMKEMYVCEGARTSYSFLHLSIQEFLAAWYVSRQPNLVNAVNPHIDLHQDIANTERYLQVFVQFLAGIAGCKKLGVYCSGQLSDFMLSCFYEAQVFNTCKDFKFFADKCSVHLATPLDMYRFGYILTNAPVLWKLSSSISYDMLVSSLADHQRCDRGMLGSVEGLVLRDCNYITETNLLFSSHFLSFITDLTFAVSLESDECLLYRFIDWLIYIASVCKVSSLKRLTINVFSSSLKFCSMPPQMCCKFFSILNNSLCCNSALHIELSNNIRPLCDIPISMLSLALRKDPEIEIEKLQRSKSLQDLSTLEFEHNGIPHDRVVPHIQSCPDLLEVQSVNHMHPSLHELISINNEYNEYYSISRPRLTLSQWNKVISRLIMLKKLETCISESVYDKMIKDLLKKPKIKSCYYSSLYA